MTFIQLRSVVSVHLQYIIEKKEKKVNKKNECIYQGNYDENKRKIFEQSTAEINNDELCVERGGQWKEKENNENLSQSK